MHVIPALHNWMASLPEELQQALTQRMPLRQLRDGETLYSPGQPGDAMYQVVSGRIRVCNFAPDGREFVFGLLYEGDCVGDLALLDGLPRINHAIAEGDLQVRVLHRNLFNEFYLRHPEIARAINLMLARRLRLAFGALEDTATLPLKERVARYLVRLALANRAEPQAPPAAVQLVAVSHEQLASLLGAARPSISKALKRLEQEQLIVVRYGGVEVLDLNGLSMRYDRLMGSEGLVPAYRER